jgi:hypothetical protein
MTQSRHRIGKQQSPQILTDMLEDALEQFREDQIRRRFGELIAGAAERN